MIMLRPHHALCLIGFVAENFSELYIEIMQHTISSFNNNPKQEITISLELDAICGYCPHNEKGVCKKSENVFEITQNILRLSGVSYGETMTWETLRSKMIANIVANGKFNETCGNCSYYEQCKEVVRTAI